MPQRGIWKFLDKFWHVQAIPGVSVVGLVKNTVLSGSLGHCNRYCNNYMHKSRIYESIMYRLPRQISTRACACESVHAGYVGRVRTPFTDNTSQFQRLTAAGPSSQHQSRPLLTAHTAPDPAVTPAPSEGGVWCRDPFSRPPKTFVWGEAV